MPPRGYKDMVAERSARKPRTKTATSPTSKAPRTSDPRDMEMSARASRIGRGRQTAGAAPGGQGLGGSAIYSIQDMLKHPAVEFSRGMARGPAQGNVDSITNDVMNKLSEQGLTRDETGTWGIDFAKNTAYREGRRGTSGIPSAPSLPTGPASSIPSGGGFPGPAKPPMPTQPQGKPPAPTSTGLPPGTIPRQTGGVIPRETGSGGLPPGTIPRQTGGTIPLQPGGSVYEPGKPPPPPQLPSNSAGNRPPVQPGLGGGFPSTVTPNIGVRQPSPGTQVSTPAYAHPAAMATPYPAPVAAGEQGPEWTGGTGYAPANTTGRPPAPQQFSGYSGNRSPGTTTSTAATPTNAPANTTQTPQMSQPSPGLGQYPSSREDPNVRSVGFGESPQDYTAYLASRGYGPDGKPMQNGKPPQPQGNGQGPGGANIIQNPQPQGGQLPPGTIPRQGQPGGGIVSPGSPTGRQAPQPQGKPPQGFPPSQPTQIPGRSPQGMPQMPQRPGQGSNNQLGGDIQAQVAAMISGIQGQVMGRTGQGTGAMNAGLTGLAGLGDRIKQDVQGRMGQMNQPGQVGQPGGVQLPGLAGLGARIQQDVQARMGQGRGLPTVPQGGGGQAPVGPGPTNPGQPTNPLPPQPGPTAPGNPGTPGGPAPTNPPPQGSGGTIGSYGNQSVDQWDSAFIAAGNAHGVDPTILKAMMEIESGGNGNMSLDQCRDDGFGDGGSCGPMQIKPNIWGQSATVEDQIMLAAKILGDYKSQHPGATDKDALMAVYFPTDDPNGTTQGSYGAKVDQLMGQMGPYNPNAAPPVPPGQVPTDQTGVPVPPGGVPPVPPGTVPAPPGPNGEPPPPGSITLPPTVGQIPDLGMGQSGQTIVDIANLYVGVVPYESLDVWNGNPGAGVDPRDPAQHGWDCSGMIYWLDQNYGKGGIPQGSHEQYDYFAANDPNFFARNAAVNAGDYSSLQPGDIVYLNTNGTYRNNAASHVVMYAGNGQFVNSANPGEGTTVWNGLNGYEVLGVATYW